jgi:3-hydroxybutyryl-CoA dehydrogenase
MITPEQVQTIAVCGAGTMGAGIAQVAAVSGYYTVLFDIQLPVLEKAKDQITKSLAMAVEKGKLTASERDGALKRIRFTQDAYDCIAEVIIEAIVEKTAAKIALFNQLSEINHSDTIFASNTSSLSIAAIAEGVVVNPSRIVGMHFFNPAWLMKLVEVVSGAQTSATVSDLIYDLALRMGKTPVRVKDAPGFIVNRVARHYYLEAMHVAAEGVAAYTTIDRLLENAGFRMGPFALMDLIGNDINLAVTQSLYSAFAQAPRFKPHVLQEQRVAEGHLGRKTGKGFYEYK